MGQQVEEEEGVAEMKDTTTHLSLDGYDLVQKALLEWCPQIGDRR